MSLSQRILTGQTHRREHREGQRPTLEDQTCPICFPIPEEIDPKFVRFWNFYTGYLAPSATEFSILTVQRYSQADILRSHATEIGYIGKATSNILRNYQQVLHTIHYNSSPPYTTTQLALQTLILSLCSGAFTNIITERTHNLALQCQNPVLNDHACYNIIKQLVAAYTEQSRSTRTNILIAPVIAPFQSPRTVPGTPVPSETSSNEQETEIETEIVTESSENEDQESEDS